MTNRKELKEAQEESVELEALKDLNVVIEDLAEANEVIEGHEEIEVAEVEAKAINQIFKAVD